MIQKDGYTGAESTVRHYVAQVRKKQNKVSGDKGGVPAPEFDPARMRR